MNIVNLNIFSLKWFVLKNWKKYDIVIDMEEYLNISAIMSFFLGKYSVGYSHGIRSLVYSRKARYKANQHVSKTFFDLVKVLGVRGNVKKLEKLNFTGTDKKIVELALRYSGIKKKHLIVGIAAGAAESSRSRMWPRQNFAALIEKISKKKKNAKIILIGAKYEKSLNESIINLIENKRVRNKVFNFAGKFTLRQTFYLISRCKVFIGNDSGPMHIAAALKVPTVAIFGPTNHVRWKPRNENAVIVRRDMDCWPCSAHKCRRGF